jgi:maltose O-acetyltransferase
VSSSTARRSRSATASCFGPGVHVYAATHPVDAETRSRGLEYARPVTIGDDVWIGGAAVVLPGVTIGDRAVVGAGSIVTHDVPADVVAAGNPCRPLRELEAV